jgi:hypothetical protein
MSQYSNGSIGHPVSALHILVIHLLEELERRNKRRVNFRILFEGYLKEANPGPLPQMPLNI